LRVFAKPRVWFIIAGVTAVLAIIYFAYLTAIASPEENLKDLPIALINEDEGGMLGGEEVNLGHRVVEKITAPDSPAPPFVRWTRIGDRAAALKGVEEGTFYAAIVLPKDYSQHLASMSGPPAGALPSGAPTGQLAAAEIELP
jgi:YhgE/Pip-like protein